MEKKKVGRVNTYSRQTIKIALLMKLAIVITLATCLQASAAGHSQEARLSLKMNQVPISRVLKTIERQTDYKFVYSNHLFPSGQTIDIEVKDTPVTDILSKILDNTGFTFKKVADDLIVITKKQTESEPMAVWLTIKGKITNSKGEGLPSVTVTVENTNTSTTTNAAGEFTITADGSAVLLFSSVGFTAERIAVNNRSVIDVTLAENISNLNEVVVIGYGQQRARKDVTGSIATVSAADIGKSTSPTSQLAMQGRMAGVLVSTPSGNPNDRPVVRIRGVGSFNAASNNDPLYVVDGIPITEGGAPPSTAALNDLRTPINIFTLIDPNDIESISVLKDASAAAIYGVRASNGVILITTKRSKIGKPKVDVNGYYGIQNVAAKKPKLLNTSEFVTLYNEAYNNNPTGTTPIGQTTAFGPVWDPTHARYLGNSPTYDWYDVYLNKNAPVKDLNVKIYGANEGMNYYISAGYYNAEGALIGSNLERYSLATNISAKIAKFLEAGLTSRISYEHNLNHTNINDLNAALTVSPWQAIYGNGPKGYAPVMQYQFVPNPGFNDQLISSGNLKNIAAGYPIMLYGPQTRLNGPGLLATTSNHYYIVRGLGNAYLQISPVKGLKIKGTIAGDYMTNRNNNYSENFNYYHYMQSSTNPWAIRDSNLLINANVRQTLNKSLTKSITAIYNLTLGSHNFDLWADASEQRWSFEYTNSAGALFYWEPNLQATRDGQIQLSRGSFAPLEKRALIGYVGRIGYKYEDKYYLDATVRRDGSSRFAPEQRWGTFPAFAAAWRISAEKFFPKLKWLDDLKIRTNWGQLGNEQSTLGWAYLSLINPPNFIPDYPLGSGPGIYTAVPFTGAALPAYPNKELTWETSITSGIGFDASLFKNKLTVTLEYYNRTTKNIIVSIPPIPSTGIEANTDRNIGELYNRGFELTAAYNGKIGPVQISISGNFTTVSNKITKIYGDGTKLTGFDNIREGYSMGFIYGFQFGGIFQNQAEIDAWRAKYQDVWASSSTTYMPKPGDAYFLDIQSPTTKSGESEFNKTPDGKITADDQTILGKTIAGHYYGLNINPSYKGFDLSIFFQGIGDVQKYNTARAAGESMNSTGINQWATVNNRWTTTNPSTSMPRAVYNDPNKNTRVSSRFVEDAGFLRLKVLQLGYTLPKKLLDKLGFINSSRVYVGGINLFTITPYTGLDPENDFNPPVKQVLFGFNLSF